MTLEIQIDRHTVGVALLVSNDYKGLSELPFVHEDTDHMERMFKTLCYAVCRKKNVSYEDFMSCCRKLADYSYPPMCKRILVYSVFWSWIRWRRYTDAKWKYHEYRKYHNLF